MINTARERSGAAVQAILDRQKPCGNTFRLASRPLITAVLLATLTAGGQSAFGGADDSKSAVGSHQAPLADVHLHYVVAGHGPLLLVTSPGWGLAHFIFREGLLRWKNGSHSFISTREVAAVLPVRRTANR